MDDKREGERRRVQVLSGTSALVTSRVTMASNPVHPRSSYGRMFLSPVVTSLSEGKKRICNTVVVIGEAYRTPITHRAL